MAVEVARSALRKLARLRTSGNGRLGSIGQDYNRGHRTYVSQLPPGHQLWLRTKPFSAPPSFELAPCLHTFVHIVRTLDLGLRAQVLDVGCGPGWMSEFLARCGYWVTGVDISEEMVEIARERVAAIELPVGEGLEAHAEFHALPVREMPWSDRFDAAILYDTMHHFDDELETLRVIHRTLVPGGRIYIREGVMPPPGSESERALVAEMEEYGTLEAPFEPRYLLQVVRDAGFVDVKRLMEVDELVEVGDARSAARHLYRYLKFRLGRGETNTVVATKPVRSDAKTDAANFSARFEPVQDAWRPIRPGDDLAVALTITNTGRAFWPRGVDFPFPEGSVTIAPFVRGPAGERIELPRTPLPRSVSPDEDVHLQVRVAAASVEGHDEISLDLVREGLAWFSELGGEPLVLPIER